MTKKKSKALKSIKSRPKTNKAKKVNIVKKTKPAKKSISKPIKLKSKPKVAPKPVGKVQQKATKAEPVIKVQPKVGGKAEPVISEASTIIKGNFQVKVENVVAFATLGVLIPLQKLVQEVENTEYEPEQFPGLVYRPTNPRAAALIFSSGKIVCTGAKSIENAKLAMHKVAETIRGVGIKVPKVFPIVIENIVASSKIKAQLNLEEIAFMLENAEYEPEQFPGLVFRITEPRVAFLLFSSGKIICTGAHSLDDVLRALDKFKEKLEEIGIKVTPLFD